MLRLVTKLLLGMLFFAGQALASVDINSAGQSELETLPGIGPSKAAAIIDFRTQNGPFATVDALDDVPGIGPATLANLRSQVNLGDGTAAASPAPPSGSPAPTTSSSAGRININTASQGELEDLPGIGPSKATAIIEHRTQYGTFGSCADIQEVTGIGPATATAVEPVCTVD